MPTRQQSRGIAGSAAKLQYPAGTLGRDCPIPAEKEVLLSALHSVPNVILLSGDRYEFAAIEYEAGKSGHNVLELSTSPMSMFYVPFVRTLRPRSEAVVNKTREEVIVAEDGSKEVIQYVVEVPKEKVLKYIGEGNYKWYVIAPQ